MGSIVVAQLRVAELAMQCRSHAACSAPVSDDEECKVKVMTIILLRREEI